MIAFSCKHTSLCPPSPHSAPSSISHLSTLISQFSFGVSEICDFEFWLEIKLSLAISIKSEAAAAEAGALRKQAYVCISDESAAPAPGLSSVPLPPPAHPAGASPCSDPPPSNESSGRRRTSCIVSFGLCSLILRLNFPSMMRYINTDGAYRTRLEE